MATSSPRLAAASFVALARATIAPYARAHTASRASRVASRRRNAAADASAAVTVRSGAASPEGWRKTR